MKSRKNSDGTHVLLLEKREDVHATIDAYCQKHNILGGSLQAIGGADHVTLGYWKGASQGGYYEKTFPGFLEITSLLGTITDIGVHLHGTFAQRNYGVVGGHVAKARTNPMLEVFLTPAPRLKRKDNKTLKLKLLDL
ncbi:Uncharacterised protein [uncultured archaeon]|nr:Uncharacterised protein [uncultured archaeon]